MKYHKILIAEDEKPLARALSLKFQKVGIASDVAYDGEELREKFDQGEYDLVLMDLMMPKHDGFAFMEEMKKRGSALPIIVMSNLSQDTDRNRAAIAGATHYFVKSDVPLSEIVSYIKETFDQ
jgi:DNA-binding response OmpR family regulator